MELPEGLILGIVPEREDPTDLFLSVDYDSLENLPARAVVGTSSLRRQAQVLAQRPDLEVVSLRGNVDTRLRKLTEGQFAAIIMATAGMKRLGLSVPKECPLAPPAFIPAVGQGALGIEFREDRKDLAEMLSFMEHRPTRICVEAERGLLAGLDGGCQVPIAGHAEMLDDGTFELEGLVGEVDGSVIIRRKVTGRADEARAVGFALARPSPRTAGPRSSPGCTRGKFSAAGLFRLPLSRFDFPGLRRKESRYLLRRAAFFSRRKPLEGAGMGREGTVFLQKGFLSPPRGLFNPYLGIS